MKLKRIVGTLAVLIGIYLFSVCTNAAVIVVESKSAEAGSPAEISVSIKPSGDEAEAVNAYAVSLAYDSAVLTPVVQDTTDENNPYGVSAIDDGVFVSALADNTLTAAWAGGTAIEFSEETKLFTVQFTVADDVTADSTDITLTVIQYAEYADGSAQLADINDISTGTITLNVEILRGDANGDGAVDSSDAALIRSYLVQLAEIDDKNMTNADANGDGAIDSSDAALIRSYLVQLADL